MNKIIGSLLFVPLLAGCPSVPVPAQSIQIDGAMIEVKLTSVRPSMPDGHDSLIFGTLQVVGQEKFKSANLDCVALRWGSNHSKRVYVDSVASVLTNPFPASDGRILVDVYWALPNVKLDVQDLASVRVERNDKLADCINYL